MCSHTANETAASLFITCYEHLGVVKPIQNLVEIDLKKISSQNTTLPVLLHVVDFLMLSTSPYIFFTKI